MDRISVANREIRIRIRIEKVFVAFFFFASILENDHASSLFECFHCANCSMRIRQPTAETNVPFISHLSTIRRSEVNKKCAFVPPRRHLTRQLVTLSNNKFKRKIIPLIATNCVVYLHSRTVEVNIKLTDSMVNMLIKYEIS